MRRYAPEFEHKRGSRAGFRRRMNERDDAGLTLVELLVSAILFVTVGTLVSVSLDTFLNVSNQVHSSYANTQQILPVSTYIQRLVRTQVEPGPQYVNTQLTGSPLVPLPPFLVGAETTTSATFYANVGVAAIGTNAGQPAKVVAALTTANGTPSPTGTTFTVTDQLADANSCPTTASPLRTCTFGTNPVKRVASITNVVNATYAPTPPATTPTTLPATVPTPVFTYILLNAAGVQSTVAASSVATTFASCTGLGDLCPADEVQGVELDLFVKSPGSKSLTPAEDDTIVYRLSSTSYLYSPTVG